MKYPFPVLLAFSLASVAETYGENLKPGTNQVEFMHGKESRQMLVRLPGDYDTSKKYPVVFGFHGAGGPMEGYHRQLERLVRDHGYISVSPQGLSNGKRNRRGVTAWNGFSNHRFSSADDVGFVVKTVDYLDRHASVDRSRRGSRCRHLLGIGCAEYGGASCTTVEARGRHNVERDGRHGR